MVVKCPLHVLNTYDVILKPIQEDPHTKGQRVIFKKFLYETYKMLVLNIGRQLRQNFYLQDWKQTHCDTFRCYLPQMLEWP